MTLISIWQEIHIFSYREMENAVPLSVFWGLNFPRNLLLSFNKHTAHSLPLKHSGNLLVQEKWSRETVFISSAKDTLISVKDRMKLLMLILTLCAVVPLEGNTAIIQVRPTLGLLFVRKIGSNADIKKTNQDGKRFWEQKIPNMCLSCSLLLPIPINRPLLSPAVAGRDEQWKLDSESRAAATLAC